MLRASVVVGLLGGTAALNITTKEKVVWMEFPGLLTVVRMMTRQYAPYLPLCAALLYRWLISLECLAPGCDGRQLRPQCRQKRTLYHQISQQQLCKPELHRDWLRLHEEHFSYRY